MRERTRALEEAQIEILERLAMAAEFRDDNTGQHTAARRPDVGAPGQAARSAGQPQVALIRRAAPNCTTSARSASPTRILHEDRQADAGGVRDRQDAHDDRRAHPARAASFRCCGSPRRSPSRITSDGTAAATPASGAPISRSPGASSPSPTSSTPSPSSVPTSAPGRSPKRSRRSIGSAGGSSTPTLSTPSCASSKSPKLI